MAGGGTGFIGAPGATGSEGGVAAGDRTGFIGVTAAIGRGAGRGVCIIGTLTTGNFGLLDLMLNSTCWPGGTWNPCGKASKAVKDLPGCISLI